MSWILTAEVRRRVIMGFIAIDIKLPTMYPLLHGVLMYDVLSPSPTVFRTRGDCRP
jgi:hypothetical protein